MAFDTHGRRYLEVPVFPPGRLRDAFANTREDCVECGEEICHGRDRYFQRNDPTDGSEGGFAGELMALTFDPVCGACGDKLIRRPS